MTKEIPIIKPGKKTIRASPCGSGFGLGSLLCQWSFVIWFCLAVALLPGCSGRKQTPAERSAAARALFEQATKEFHNPSAEAIGAEKTRLLKEAAKRYEELLKDYPEEQSLGAQALRGLGNVRASQGQTNEAVSIYAAMAEKFPAQDWEVLQAWKAAADLLWEANRREEARLYYRKIVTRFDQTNAPMIFRTVVRGSKSKLAE